jgi:hypothetical protein
MGTRLGRGWRWAWILATSLAVGGCSAPYRVVPLRREAGARLGTCLEFAQHPYRGEAARRACLEESKAYCRLLGLEAGCAVDEQWGGHPSQL